MLQLFKWIYNLGKFHERKNIQRLLFEYTREKPIWNPNHTFSDQEYEYNQKAIYQRNLDTYHEVSRTIGMVLENISREEHE